MSSLKLPTLLSFDIWLRHPSLFHSLSLCETSSSPDTQCGHMSESHAVVFKKCSVEKCSVEMITITEINKKICTYFLCQVSKEKNRFEKLMEYFIIDDCNIDFMVG